MTHKDDKIEERYYDVMNKIARGLDEILNGDAKGDDRETGFVLLVFPYEADKTKDPRCNYISNGADRKDIVCLMKEMIARFEGQPEMKGHA